MRPVTQAQRSSQPLLRSLLFAPASRPEILLKMPRAAPDCAVIDLEDGVAEKEKEASRATARAAISEVRALAPQLPLYVRVNGTETPWFAGDLEDVVAPARVGMVLPKVGRASQLFDVVRSLTRLRVEPTIIVGIETALGVANVAELLGPPVVAVYFGSEDYLADMRGADSGDGLVVLYARSRVALHAKVAGIVAVDRAVVAVQDMARFRADAVGGRNLGYAGKICLNPAQVALANEEFGPTVGRLDWARRVLAAQEEALARGAGVTVVDGQMVDSPAFRLARAILDAAEGLGTS